MTRALVTGGSGFIGANLVRRLLADGIETHVLLRPGRPGWRLEAVARDLVRHAGDVSDPDSVDRAFSQARPEWVFHLAAHGAYPTQTDLQEMIRTNIVGTSAVVQAGTKAGSEAIILAGSSSEYGLKDHPPSEDEAIEPDSDYAVTKAAATMYGMKEARRTGVKITTLRLYSAFGPWEEPSRLWPTLLVHAMEGRLPRLADPSTARDFVYVDDVVEAFVLAARVPHQATVLNVGSGIQSTLADVVEAARRRFQLAAEALWGSMSSRSWDTSVWVADSQRAKDVLGWVPRIALPMGLEAFTAWLESDPGVLDRYRTHVARVT
jgi:dolichol-phosphate mannosyltransferase